MRAFIGDVRSNIHRLPIDKIKATINSMLGLINPRNLSWRGGPTATSALASGGGDGGAGGGASASTTLKEKYDEYIPGAYSSLQGLFDDLEVVDLLLDEAISMMTSSSLSTSLNLQAIRKGNGDKATDSGGNNRRDSSNSLADLGGDAEGGDHGDDDEGGEAAPPVTDACVIDVTLAISSIFDDFISWMESAVSVYRDMHRPLSIEGVLQLDTDKTLQLLRQAVCMVRKE
jgi:hypothetical protein